MTLAICFWVLMLLWLVVEGIAFKAKPSLAGVLPSAMPFLLFLVIGWAVFGAPIKG